MQRITRVSLWWVLFCAAGTDGQEGMRPRRLRAAEAVPAPPQQTAAWTAPQSKLPKLFVSATAALFRQGLADPRGCRYCAIEVRLGSRREDNLVSTHGWLVPAAANAPPRFAVCWDGSVQPVTAKIGPADLRADVRAAVQACRDAQAKRNLSNYDLSNGNYQPASVEEDGLEASALSDQRPRPLWACLLLRLGEVAAAEQIWDEFAPAVAQSNDAEDVPADPYLDLAGDWTWPLFSRALYAHASGDDRLALQTASLLAPVREAVEAEAAKRGCPRPERMPWQCHDPSYLEEIASIRELLADQQRRAAQRQAGKSPPVTAAADADPDATLAALRQALKQCPDVARRIALLVQELEEVSGQEARRSRVDLAADPVVQLLIEAGEPAVEPLLACLENDVRLTRGMHRGYPDYDTAAHALRPIAVAEAAYTALAAILETNFFGNALTADDLTAHGKPGRAALARRIRGYFNKYRGLPREERWYRILLDDRAPMGRWVEAAQKLVQPPDEREPGRNNLAAGGWTLVAGRWHKPIRKRGETARWPGEPLRHKSNPSVTEILQQRIGELPADMARDVAMALADWDPQAGVPVLVRLTHELPPRLARVIAIDLAEFDAAAALPALRRLSQAARAEFGKSIIQRDPNNRPDWQSLVDLLLARMAIHDRQALEEYVQWVRTVPREQADDDRERFFSPLLQNPRDPLAGATAEWLFNDAQSPWNPIIGNPQDKDYVARFGRQFDAPLLVLPAFRKQLLRLLADRRVAGRATANAGQQQFELLIDKQWMQWGGSSSGSVPYPPPHATAEFRTCDWIAQELSEIHGMPRCELYWPQAQRDKAVAACAGILRQYGERFQMDGAGRAMISLRALDHPATPEDVQAGRAIFSLAGQGATRMVPLPWRPVWGQWTALNDYPSTHTVLEPKTNRQKTITDCDREGAVWQAEEVQVNGVWRRYFGFIGRYCLAKVPAEEINLSFPDDCAAQIDGFRLYGSPPSEQIPPGSPLPWIGGPLPLEISARNDTGLDRRLPTFVFEEQGVARPKDRVGLSFVLSYADRRAGESFDQQQDRLFIAGAKPPAWRDLPRKAVPLRLNSIDRPLKPLETVSLLKIDLRDHFQLPGAGWYRIVVTLATDRKRPDDQLRGENVFFVDRKPVQAPKWE
jgi:hypothetical protein